MAARASPFAPEAGFASDVDWFVDQVAAHYAYLPERLLDLSTLRAFHRMEAARAEDRAAFLPVLERLVAELHDHHITINSNNDLSPQLVPTGADLWGEMRDGRAWITEVRLGSAAEKMGLHAGDEVVSFAGLPIARLVAGFRPKALKMRDPEADDFVLRTFLAGDHRNNRMFVIRTRGGAERDVVLRPYVGPPGGPLVSIRALPRGMAAIRIENSLGDSDLVAAFDEALAQVKDAPALILDLRNTPSGGDSDIAEPILGRFITGTHGYQRVFTPGRGKSFPKDSWVKPVKGRGPFTYVKPLVVLCGRWTGSMGEGMVIGLDGLKRSTTVGTRMAGLCGGTEGFRLPKSGYSVHLPTERLYHINNTPRESWTPHELLDLERAPGADPVLARGVEIAGLTAG